jgi:hypothetical protein
LYNNKLYKQGLLFSGPYKTKRGTYVYCDGVRLINGSGWCKDIYYASHFKITVLNQKQVAAVDKKIINAFKNKEIGIQYSKNGRRI